MTNIRFLLFFAFTFILIGCSPLSRIVLQNNTNNSIDVFVELKNVKSNINFRKNIKNRNLYYYNRADSVNVFALEQNEAFYVNNVHSPKDYNFLSDHKYEFKLNTGLLSYLDPANSESNFPFEKVYYVLGEEKCYVVPEVKKDNCNYSIIKKQILNKNQKVKELATFIIINN